VHLRLAPGPVAEEKCLWEHIRAADGATHISLPTFCVAVGTVRTEKVALWEDLERRRQTAHVNFVLATLGFVVAQQKRGLVVRRLADDASIYGSIVQFFELTTLAAVPVIVFICLLNGYASAAKV